MDKSANARLIIELHDFCKSDSLSEEGLCEIIERHGLTPNDDNALINYYFFFAACRNERVDEGILRSLLEYFPGAAGATIDRKGWTPLHLALTNKSVTLNIIQLLIDAAPDSLRSVSNSGHMPLHILCGSKEMNKSASVEILKLLIEKYPEAVRFADNEGALPIHIAAGSKTPKFCQVLIEAYPESERITTAEGELPLHNACRSNIAATVEFLHKLYSDTINHEATNGFYPIHFAMSRTLDRNKLTGAAEIVQYQLDCHPNVKFQKCQGESLLYVACTLTSHQNYNDPNTIVAALDVVKAIYDAHPEAIEGESIVRDMQSYHHHVRAFINSELVYARQAKDPSLMAALDDNGHLPLHKALQNDVSLGSIKLLVKGYPHAVQSPDNSGALPLHIACEHHDSARVIRFLVGLDTDTSTLEVVDRESNTALHLACRGARHETISLLLDQFDAVSVSKRSVDKKLPIDLLFESDVDRESVAYTESVYRLLRAYPEMIMGVDAKVQSSAALCLSLTGKKRKLGDE